VEGRSREECLTMAKKPGSGTQTKRHWQPMRKKLKREMKRNDRGRGTTGEEEEKQTTRRTGRDMTTRKTEERKGHVPILNRLCPVR
jgi:hypothetical protein